MPLNESHIAAREEISFADLKLKYTYWKSKDGWFVDYLNIWPDHFTQGRCLMKLEDMLADLYEFYKEEVSCTRRSGALYCS